MRILVAGASGVLGARVVPMLLADGHDVTGTTRRVDRGQALSDAGAHVAIVDAYDATELQQLVRAARPDVILHLLTDLGEGSSDANAQMRILGTRNLVDAARSAGVPKLVAQSIAWAYAPGERPADETVELDLEAGPPRSRTIEGVVALERAVAEIPQSVVLRLGVFYGAGTWYSEDGFIATKLRAGEAVASSGLTSFVHVDDAARAVVRAVDWRADTVNIVDDDPAPGAEWQALFADVIGAPAPKSLPPAADFERGADNSRARRRYRWSPCFSSWRDGFPTALRGGVPST